MKIPKCLCSLSVKARLFSEMRINDNLTGMTLESPNTTVRARLTEGAEARRAGNLALTSNRRGILCKNPSIRIMHS